MVGEDFEEVRFESSMVFVSIWRCPSRLEWDVEVGLRQQPHQDGFSVVSDIVALHGGDEERTVTPMWSDTLFSRALAEQAQFLKEYGGRALAGDVAFFQKLSEARSERIEAHWRVQTVEDAMRKAA
jgi:hypothetical protein